VEAAATEPVAPAATAAPAAAAAAAAAARAEAAAAMASLAPMLSRQIAIHYKLRAIEPEVVPSQRKTKAGRCRLTLG